MYNMDNSCCLRRRRRRRFRRRFHFQRVALLNVVGGGLPINFLTVNMETLNNLTFYLKIGSSFTTYECTDISRIQNQFRVWDPLKS